MEPNEISELLSSGDPEQIKQGQKALQGLGYYDGAIDGQMGPNTVDAIGKYRDDSLAESQAEATQSENDPLNQAIRFGTDVGPYAVGAGAGYLGGRGARSFLNEADRRQGNMAQALAGDESLTPESAKRGIDRMNRRRAVRNIGQFAAPAALFGTSEILQEWAQNPQTNEDLAESLNTVAAAERGAGTIMGAKQLMDAPKRFGESPNDPVDVARIESRLQRSQQPSPMAQALASQEASQAPAVEDATAPRTRAGTPAGGEAPEERVRHSERARRAARAAGVSDVGRKSDNIEAVKSAIVDDEAARKAVAKELDVAPGRNYLQRISRALDDLGPRGAAAVAAVLGYDAIRGEAEAGEGGEETGGSMAEALMGAGAAGGAAYGTMKGAQKGAEGLGNLASRYMPGVARAAGRAFPPAAAALTAYDLATMPQESVPEDVGRARHERAQPLVNPLGRGRNQQASPMARALAGQ